MEKKKFTALLSVYNKTGIVEFARELLALEGYDEVTIISSGGTANVLKAEKLPVTDVADISGLPPVLGHRVVTLVPHIHGGLLATDDQLEELEKLGYPRIDLVCVDLYPLQEEIAKWDATSASVIEKTDIGGPTMLRSGAKGRRIVVCDPNDRKHVIAWLKEGRPQEDTFITELAAKAEGIIAGYCLASAQFHSGDMITGVIGTQVSVCKYGENAWQTPAALYSTGSDDPLALDKFQVVAGQPPSYNNLCDLDRMLQTLTHMAEALRPMGYAAIAAKHGNPCGAAADLDTFSTGEPDERPLILQKMIDGDKRAIFGGLIMTTFEIDEPYAEILLSYGVEKGRRVLDGIVAPSFTPEAIAMLRRKEDKCRFIQNPALALLCHKEMRGKVLDQTPRIRQVRGGFLKQPNYTFVPSLEPFMLKHDSAFKSKYQELLAQAEASEKKEEAIAQVERMATIMASPKGVDCLLAWAIGSTSNSNTITLVKDGMLIGNGTGQQDRVGCCELALKRARDAGHDPMGAVAYSDSFFPFPDGPKALIDAGIRAIFTTSGSIKDAETRKVCEEAGVALYVLPDAEARGFYGH